MTSPFGDDVSREPTWPIFSDFEVITWQGPAAEPLEYKVHSRRLVRANELVAGWRVALAAAGVPDEDPQFRTHQGALWVLDDSIKKLGYRSILEHIRPIDLFTDFANTHGKELYEQLQTELAKDPLDQDTLEQGALENALRRIRSSVLLADSALSFVALENTIREQ